MDSVQTATAIREVFMNQNLHREAYAEHAYAREAFSTSSSKSNHS